MADLTKTVEIIFGGKNDLTKTLGSIERDFGRVTDVVGNVAKPLAGMADSILKVDAALVALAVGGIALATRESGRFSGQFNEITTLFPATGASVDKLRRDILTYAVDSTQSIESINKAIYAAVSAGVDYTKSLDFVAKAEKLAVAGKADLQSTTLALVSTMNAYGASTEEAGRYSDIFVKTIQLGQTNLPALAQSIAQVTSIAVASGVSFETLSAAISTLTYKGMPTSQAITAIKGALTALIKPTNEAEETAQSLGIQFSAQALKAKGLEGVLQEVMKATGGNTEQVAKLFGNIEGLNGVLSLGAQNSDIFRKHLSEMKDAAGSTATAYAKVVNDFDNVNQRLKNSFEVTLITIGDRLLPKYGQMAGAMGDLMKGIKVGVDQGAFDPLFEYLDKIGSSIAKKLASIAVAFPEAVDGLDFSNFLRALEDLGTKIKEAFEAIFGEIDLNTPEGLREVIQRIIDGFTSLTKVTEGIIDGMKPLFQLIGKGVKEFESLDDATSKSVGYILGLAKSFNTLTEYIGPLTAALATLATGSLLNATKAIFGLGASVTSALPMLAGLVTSTAAVTAGGVAVAGAVGYGAGTLLNEYVPAVGKAAQGLFGLLDVNEDFFGAQGRTREEMQKVDSEFQKAVENQKKMKSAVEGTSEAVKTGTWDWVSLQKVFDQISKDAVTINPVIKDIVVNPGVIDDTKKKLGIEVMPELGKDALPRLDKEISVLQENLARMNYAKNQLKIMPAVDKGAVKELDAQMNIVKAELALRMAEKKKIQVKVEPSVDKDALARLKEQSAIVQKTIEWSAKIRIAEVEAGVKALEAAFKSLDTRVTSTGTTLTDMMKSWGDENMSYGQKSQIEKWLSEEAKYRAEAMRQSQKLTEQQIRLNELRIEAMKNGDAQIRVSADGLKPHLEMILWEVLEAVQIRASQNQAEFLLGWNP